MSSREENSPDGLNSSIDGEFNSEQNENGLNSSSSETEMETEKRRTQIPSPNPQNIPPAFMVAASPPKFVSFEQLMAAANGVKNMKLAHEIVVDSDFKLEALNPESSGVEKQVREIMHKAFWDALQGKISQDPPDFSHALVLIEEIKEALLSLLMPQHVRLRAQIAEVLDLDLIRQKMANNAFDIYYYADYVVGIMARLCAPVRDEQIAKVKDNKEVVPLFKEIFRVLELMKMDMANFTIQQMRPYLQQQSVEYERKKFQEFLRTQEENGTDGLQFTKLWLKRNFEKLLQEEAASPEGASSCSKATPASIMNEAYMELLRWDHKQIYPETLLMDQSRFLELQSKVRQLSLIASVLLVTYSTVGTPIAGIQELKLTLKSHIMTILDGVADSEVTATIPSVGEQVKKEVNKCLTKHGFPLLSEDKEKMLLGQITDVVSPDHSVAVLMSKRVTNFMQSSITSRHTEPLKVPPGFSAVEAELSQVLGKFLRLISHNRSVFGTYYAEIIGTLIRKQQDLSPR